MKNDTTDTPEIEYVLHTRTDAELIALAGRILGSDFRLTLREAVEVIRGGYHAHQRQLAADPHPECCGTPMDFDGRLVLCFTCGNRREM